MATAFSLRSANGDASRNGRTTPNVQAKPRAKKPKVHELSLAQILDDTDLQPRTSLDVDILREYTSAWIDGDIFPPIVVFFDGENYWLADGFYRTRSARKAGKSSIIATVYDGDKRDAKLYSAGANASHGVRRTNEDKKKAIIKLLDDPEWCVWNDTVIAKHCRVSSGVVGKYRKGSSGLLGHGIDVRIGENGEVRDTRARSEDDTKKIAGVAPGTFIRPPALMSKAEVVEKFVGKIARHLKKSDPATQTNVSYEFGACEILTSTRVICFVSVFDRTQLYAAYGRMMVCRDCLNPAAKITIVGHFPKSVGDLIRKFGEMGVECRTPEQVLAD